MGKCLSAPSYVSLTQNFYLFSYPIGEATWERESAMANPVELINNFAEAAEGEGLNLDQNPNKAILLKDARRSGWKPNDS